MPVNGRVMILEDEPELLEMLTVFLSDLGYTVCAASESESALEFIQNGGIELSIVDVGAHGLRIAREAASRNIPCIMMSGRPVIFEIGGLGEVLQKPISLSDLKTKIEFLLRNFRAQISTTREKLAER
jgi:DNA-binding response OmpR family regulator